MNTPPNSLDEQLVADVQMILARGQFSIVRQVPADASASCIYDTFSSTSVSSTAVKEAPRNEVVGYLPPGWELRMVNGIAIYLDHISREAHRSPPWVVWQERARKGS